MLLRLFKNKKVKLLSLFFVFIICVCYFYYNAKSNKIILYAWERSEDFAFISEDMSSKLEIAYYKSHIVFKSGSVSIYERVSPLVIPNYLKRFPVIRIDGAKNINRENKQQAISYIVNICKSGQSHKCQIDFDYVKSEEPIYIDFINNIKDALGPDVDLSVTALVSNCYKSGVYDTIKADEVVPLFIDLSPEDLKKSYSLRSDKCKDSVGFANYQAMPDMKYFKDKDVYIFNNSSWNSESYYKTLNMLK